MRNSYRSTAAGFALAIVSLAGVAAAQTPAPNTSGTFASSAVENPTYAVINLEITVDRPIDEVWGRVGGYCQIGDWIPTTCTITSGKDNEVGAVRSVAREIMVGKSQYSYTYTQPVRAGVPYNMYHGTLEARALTPKTTKLLYTLMFDNSMLPDDAAREKDKASRTAQFTRFLQNMKTLAEGGKVEAPARRGGPPAGGAAPPPGD